MSPGRAGEALAAPQVSPHGESSCDPSRETWSCPVSGWASVLCVWWAPSAFSVGWWVGASWGSRFPGRKPDPWFGFSSFALCPLLVSLPSCSLATTFVGQVQASFPSHPTSLPWALRAPRLLFLGPTCVSGGNAMSAPAAAPGLPDARTSLQVPGTLDTCFIITILGGPGQGLFIF